MSATTQSQTIRKLLALGFSVLIFLLLAAGFVGWVSIVTISDKVDATLLHANAVAQQSARFSHVITQEVQAGTSYLNDGNPIVEEEFRRLGMEAHGLHRTFTSTRSDLAGEVANTVVVDNRLAEVENAFAVAHRLRDLGRIEESRAQAQKAGSLVGELLLDLQRVDQANNAAFLRASEDLEAYAKRRSFLLVTVLGFALLLAVIIVIRTSREIGRPLRVLVRHAVQLSRGNLQNRTPTLGMPGEFRTLAEAMNHASESLSRVVSGAAHTADDVAKSAGDLASASRQIAASAGQVAEAVGEVSLGAESQVVQLRKVNEALEGIRIRADRMVGGAAEEIGRAHV